MNVVRFVASAATLGSFLVVTVVPWLLHASVAFSTSVALEWMGLVALIWAAVFAAENLHELRRAREVEFEPIIDVLLEEVTDQGQAMLQVTLRNLGRGTAVGVQGRVWYKDADLVEWFPHELRELPEFLPAGEAAIALTHNPRSLFLADDNPPHLLVEVACRDPLGRAIHRRDTYALSNEGLPELLPWPGAADVDLGQGRKLRMLERALDAWVRQKVDLGSKGVRVEATVVAAAQAASVVRIQDRKVLSHVQRSAHTPAIRVVEDVRKYLERELDFTFDDDPPEAWTDEE